MQKNASDSQHDASSKETAKATENQTHLFADEYESLPYIDADADTEDMVHQYCMEDNEQQTISLRERMEQAAIQQKYQDDESHIQQDSVKPAVDLWAEAQQRIRQSKDERYGVSIPGGMNTNENPAIKDIPGILEGDTYSPPCSRMHQMQQK